MKGIIIYTSKYGATKQYAEYIRVAMNIPVVAMEEISGADLSKYDYFVIGSPVYIGRLRIKNWLKKNESLLTGKKIFFFMVSATEVSDLQILEKIIADNIHKQLHENMELYYLHGRMVKRNLGMIDSFLLNVGAKLSGNKKSAKKMLEDFDDVHQSAIMPMAISIKKYLDAGPVLRFQPLRDADRFLHTN